jgi:hypothetical protein
MDRRSGQAHGDRRSGVLPQLHRRRPALGCLAAGGVGRCRLLQRLAATRLRGRSNFAVQMDQAARRARRTLGVLSPQALQSPFVRQEWAQRLAADPTGEQRELVLLRVEPCQPAGCWARWSTSTWSAWTRQPRGRGFGRTGGGRQRPAATASPGRVSQSRPGRGCRTAAVSDRAAAGVDPPFRRNPAFTGREQSLAELAEQLGRGAAAAVTQTLQGPGGVGKTYRSGGLVPGSLSAREPADRAALAPNTPRRSSRCKISSACAAADAPRAPASRMTWATAVPSSP